MRENRLGTNYFGATAALRNRPRLLGRGCGLGQVPDLGRVITPPWEGKLVHEHHVPALILVTSGVQTLNVLTFQGQVRWRQHGSALSVLCTAGQWTGLWFFRKPD